MLNAGVGLSIEGNSVNAGKEVAKEALSELNTKPKLAVSAIDHLTRAKYDYAEVLKGIYEELDPEVPLIGSSACGVMVNDRIALKSVGLMLIEGDINVDANFVFEGSRRDYQGIADNLIKIKSEIERNPNQLLLNVSRWLQVSC